MLRGANLSARAAFHGCVFLDDAGAAADHDDAVADLAQIVEPNADVAALETLCDECVVLFIGEEHAGTRSDTLCDNAVVTGCKNRALSSGNANVRAMSRAVACLLPNFRTMPKSSPGETTSNVDLMRP